MRSRSERGVRFAQHKCFACYRDSTPPRPRCRYGLVLVGCTIRALPGRWHGPRPFLYAHAESTRRALLALVVRVRVSCSFVKPRVLNVAACPRDNSSRGLRAVAQSQPWTNWPGMARVSCSLSHLHARPLIDDRRASRRVCSVSRTLDPERNATAMPDRYGW